MKLNYLRNPTFPSSTQIDSLKNRLDTIEPKVTNLANIAAKTNIKNTFLTPQAIKGSTCYVEFIDNNNDRKGWIGKGNATSSDIAINAETNSLVLSANNHVLVRPGNNYQFLYERANLSNDNEVANKKYVDNKTGNYVRIVNHTSNLNANQINQWTLANFTLENQKVYEIILKTGISGKDLLASGTIMVNDKNYLNQYSTFTWSDNWNGDPNKKLVLAIHENKIKIQSNFIMNGVVIMCRKLPITSF